jgi:hypothetical protein
MTGLRNEQSTRFSAEAKNELSDVHVLEILILPVKQNSEARASLLSFRLA